MELTKMPAEEAKVCQKCGREKVTIKPPPSSKPSPPWPPSSTTKGVQAMSHELQTQSETYSPEDINRMIDQVADALPNLLSGLAEVSRQIYIIRRCGSDEQIDRLDSKIKMYGIGARTIRRIELIGANLCIPETMFAIGLPSSVESMPIETQRRLLCNKHDIITGLGDGENVRKEWNELSRDERAMLLADDGIIRSPAAQRAWLLSQHKEPPEPERIKLPYELHRKGRYVTISEPCKLEAKQLADIIAPLG